MKLARLNGRSRRACLFVCVAVGLVYAVGPIGCTVTDQVLPGRDQAQQKPGPVVVINAPTIDADVRLGQQVVVAYDAPVEEGGSLTLSLYYDVDGQADTVDDMLVASGLPTGNTYYTLDTSIFPDAGRYSLFMVAVDGSGDRSVTYAGGRINAIAARRFEFNKPARDTFTATGATVTIQFTSSEMVNYVLFYESATATGQRSGAQTTISSGSGQNVTRPWLLANIAPGTYFVGAEIHDTLGQTETIYALGKVIVNDSPIVQVTYPDANLQVYRGERVPIRFEVTDPDTDVDVVVFFDADRVPGNGNEKDVGPPFSKPTGPVQQNLDTSGLTPGLYFLGVSANDGYNTEVTVYAPGRVQVFDTNIGLQFLEPTGPQVTIAPGDALTISWQVTAPANKGTLNLWLIDLATGGRTPLLPGAAPLAPDTTIFDTSLFSLTEGGMYQLLLEGKPEPAIDGSLTLNPVEVPGPMVEVRSSAGIRLLEPPESRTLGTGDTLYLQWEAIGLKSQLNQITAQIYLDGDTVALNGNEIALVPVTVTPTSTTGTFRFSTTLDPATTMVPFGSYYVYLSINDGGTVIDAHALSGATSPSYIIITVKPRVTGTYWAGDAGKDLDGDGRPDSIIYAGFDFYDSAGSLVAPLGDFDADGYGDFLIVAQFAKPFRAAPAGDAYLIYGDPTRFAEPLRVSNASSDPNISMLSLNSVGTTIRGTLFLGLDEVDSPNEPSSGIQSAMYIPDQTGDGVGELAFGIPYLHNRVGFYGTTGAGLTPTTIARPGQFRRGGVIVATSQNEFNQSSPLPQGIYVYLDLIGQFYGGGLPQVGDMLYAGTLTDPAGLERRVTDLDPADPNTPDVHHFELTAPAGVGWSHPKWSDPDDNDMAGPRPVPPLNREPFNYQDDTDNRYQWDASYNPLLVDGNPDGSGAGDGDFNDGIPIDRCRYTGVLTGGQTSYYGSRILGNAQGSRFGRMIDWWRGGVVASSPTADPNGFAGISSRPNAGIVYYRRFTSAPWNDARAKPSNWVMADPGPFSHPIIGYDAAIIGAAANARLGPVASLGEAATGRGGDFNGDGLNDLAIGAPGMNGGKGAAYVFYVRLPTPYSFDLAGLNVANNDPDRRAGVQINGDAGDGLGSVAPDGLDFNADGYADAVFGAPGAKNGAGRVVLVYGGPQVASTGAGFSLDDIAYGPGLTQADPNKALGVVFEGTNPGDEAGGAVAAVGDFDADGADDLLIAAPGADGKFDVDGDGTDEVIPGAGLVYLIYGQRNIVGGTTKALTGYINLGEVVTGNVAGMVIVGKNPGDALGGGMTYDGVTDRTRAIGLSAAGDVDGDGMSDLLISSVRAGPSGNLFAGEVYLIFGLAPGASP